MTLLPAWAFSGQAIDAVGDSHLAKGRHYRVLTNPLLGLPVVPLVISRARLGQGAKGFVRRDITWVDSHGTVLSLPFAVTPDNPVTGYLPLGQTCCWASVEARPVDGGGGPVGPLPGRPGAVVGGRPVAPSEPAPIQPTSIQPAPIQPTSIQPTSIRPASIRPVPLPVVPTTRPVQSPRVVPPTRAIPIPSVGQPAGVPNPPHPPPVSPPLVVSPPVVRPPRPPQSALTLVGVVATPLGDAPVAVRGSAPLHVYASHIERLVVRGSGTVTGCSWLPASAVTRVEPFRISPLPAPSGARYAGPANGRDQGFERVQRGAPQRFGMHEEAGAPSPTACSPATPTDELDRLLNLSILPERTLDRLLNDTSAPQPQLLSTETVLDANGNSLGTSQRLTLLDLLQGLVDPGMARWLGTLDVDEEGQFADGEVIAYVVDALFAPDVAALARRGLRTTLTGSALFDGGVEALEKIAETQPKIMEYVSEVKRMDSGPYLVGRVVLAATVGAPLDQPTAPVMAAPVSGGWLPATAPTAIREVTVGLSSLVPAAGLASAIAQPSGVSGEERNPKDTIGRRLLLTARPDPVAIDATAGLLADRRVDERDGTWHTAQVDWFGRWSIRSGRGFGPAARPRPPRPTFTMTTSPPAVPAPPPVGMLAGVLRIEVSVPPVAGLPPGGRLLNGLKLTVTRAGSGPVQTLHALPTPSAPPDVMVIEVAGPALSPATSAGVTVTALWSDSAGVDSLPSEPKSATFHDPRPPAAVVIPPTLEYTARPDATGRARATLEWTPGAGQAAFRVFTADETTLRAKLEEVGAGSLAPGDAGQAPTAGQAQGILTALDAASDAPARGAVWNSNRHLLPRRWWRQLTGEPMLRPPSGPARFTHDVSGSLAVLAMFRVVAVSAASVETDFATSPLLPRGVPNLLVPSQPTVEVLPVVDAAGNLQAQVRIVVPVSATPAARYRLRRATATTDAALMQVVAEGAVPAPPPGGALPQTTTVIDVGTAPGVTRTSLVGWTRYHWRVEVQGPSAPGGGPVGEWSSPSDAASCVVMPPNAPASVTGPVVTREASGVHLRFSHPEPLAPGGSTGYTVDVYRQLAGGPLRLLTSIPGQAPPSTGRGADVTGTFDVVDGSPEAVAGTGYRVVVTDPIGRASAPSALVVAP